jgi:hypothetical protein
MARGCPIFRALIEYAAPRVNFQQRLRILSPAATRIQRGIPDTVDGGMEAGRVNPGLARFPRLLP